MKFLLGHTAQNRLLNSLTHLVKVLKYQRLVFAMTLSTSNEPIRQKLSPLIAFENVKYWQVHPGKTWRILFEIIFAYLRFTAKIYLILIAFENVKYWQVYPDSEDLAWSGLNPLWRSILIFSAFSFFHEIFKKKSISTDKIWFKNPLFFVS